jgi:DNA-binding transcriptional regulator YiaG
MLHKGGFYPIGSVISDITHLLNGNVLRAARNLVGWSQGELAKRSGISVNTVCRWEHENPIQAKTGTLKRVTDALLAGGVKVVGNDR